MAEKQIDSKLLEGLTYSSSEVKKVKVDGKEKIKYIPGKRALTPADVLDWIDKGDSVVIVTADGQKYVVKKAGKGKGSKE